MEKPEQFSTRAEWEDFLWDKILAKILTIRSREELGNFLDQLLSSHEKDLILRRATIMAMVKDGMSYRGIGKILWTSPMTVRAVKNVISKQANYRPHQIGRRNAAVRVAKEQKEGATKKTLDVLENLLAELAGELIRLEAGYFDASKRWEFLNKKRA